VNHDLAMLSVVRPQAVLAAGLSNAARDGWRETLAAPKRRAVPAKKRKRKKAKAARRANRK
jgi:hypothetical protein